MSVWAIVVAAGGGSRFGGLKQYELLGDRRVLDWSIEAARTIAGGLVLVVPAERATDIESSADVVVAGGDSRSASVRAGLAVVPADVEIVIVQDAARPLASPELFSAVVEAVQAGAAGAVPGVPIRDTVKQVDGSRVVATLDRSVLVAVQTPQAFLAGALRRAHAEGHEATDDAALIEADGGNVVVVPGDPRNLKLTGTVDLEIARRLT